MNKEEWKRLKQDPIKYKEHREKERIRELKRKEKIRNNPELLEEHQAYFRDYTKSYGKELKRKAREVLGGMCFQCNFGDYRALEFHHTLTLKKREDTQTMCRRIINGAKDVMLLCANCHAILHYDEMQRKEVEKKIMADFLTYEKTYSEEIIEEVDPIDYTILQSRLQGESWAKIASKVGMSKSALFERGRKLGVTHNNA